MSVATAARAALVVSGASLLLLAACSDPLGPATATPVGPALNGMIGADGSRAGDDPNITTATAPQDSSWIIAGGP